MNLLRKFISLVTVTVITTTVGTWVLDSTLLNSEFVVDQIGKSGFYEQFTKDFPKFMEQSPDKQTKKDADVIAAVITPQYVQSQFESYFTQLEAHYRNGGPSPKLDFSGLKQLAAKNGFKLDLPQETVAVQDPLDPGIVGGFFSNLNRVKFGGLVASLVLVLLTWLAGASRAKLKAVSRTMLYCGIGLLPNYLVFKFVPRLIVATIEKDAKTQALAPALKPLLDTLFNTIANRFLIAAAAFGVLTVIFFGLYILLERGKGGTGKPKLKKLPRARDEGGLIPQP